MSYQLEKSAPQACQCPQLNFCICLPIERAIRMFSSGNGPVMTQPQRDECLDEISRVEGYDVDEYAHVSDQELAKTVLKAWLDDCRDKGLI